MTLGTRYFTDRSETPYHYLYKMIAYRILRELDRDCYVEFNTGSGIIDLVDFDTGMAYEFETRTNKNKIEKKIENYTSYAGIKDVKIIKISAKVTDYKMIRILLSRVLV